MEIDERVVVIGRAEIDTRQQFKSVKEAVRSTLFGESVLVREIYAKKLKEIQKASEQEQSHSRIEILSAELEETKQYLQHEKAKGSVFMAHCLASLKQELEETKVVLRKLQTRALLHTQQVDEREELKIVETPSRKVELNMQDTDDSEYFSNRRSVKFMSPPALVINSKDIREIPIEACPCNKSKKKTKRQPLILFFKRLFSRKG